LRLPSEIYQILDDLREGSDRICWTPEAGYGKTIDADKIQEKILGAPERLEGF